MTPALLPSRAYVTFLAGDGDYVKGALALAKGLRKVQSAYPLVVAVLGDVPEAHRQLLRLQGCLVREIEAIRPEGSDQCRFAMPHYVINYSKLRIWLFEEYEKIIYLDADIMVFDNIDHLFDLPNGRFYAVMDCFCEQTWSHSPQHKVKYCQQCPDRNPWPKHFGKPPAKYFNAGMFVHEPSKQTFHELMVALKQSPPTLFAEQDFLNTFFQRSYSPIPLMYNMVLAMLWRHPENVDIEKVKVAHYCATGSKPWRFTGKEVNMDRQDVRMLVEKWRSVYEDKTLDYYASSDLLSISAAKEILTDLTANAKARTELSNPASRTDDKAPVPVPPAA